MRQLCYTSLFLLSADTEWLGLVNAMSGLLCTHLNSIDRTSTYQPWHSFKPQGAIVGMWLAVHIISPPLLPLQKI